MTGDGQPRSASSLPIAVAGGGIIGLSIAMRLAESGWTVEVFDQGVPGSEASWAGAGMLAPGGEVEGESPLGALAIRSRDMYRPFVDQLERESGLSIDLQETGALELAYAAEDLVALNEKAASQQTLGIVSRAVAPKQVLTFWPRVKAESLTGARFYPNDALVNPRDVVAALRAALHMRSVRIHEHCRVEYAALSDASVELKSTSGIRSFSALVVSMGAWSSGLSVSGTPPLPAAEPIKGHLIAYHQPDQTCSTIVRLGHTYLLQRANGLLLVGASVERVGFDRSVRAEIVQDLEIQASQVFPHLAETSPTEAWVGFRPGADALQIGPWHSRRLLRAYGHYRNGILLAPVTAQIIVDTVNASSGTL